MLSYIIPPIIVIVGVAFLIYFFSRKIDKLPTEEMLSAESNKEVIKNSSKSLWKFFSQAILKVLEKLVQRFKIYSMKFHNCCQNWFQSIRRKREMNLMQKAVVEEQEEKNKKEFLENKNSESFDLPANKKIVAEEIKKIDPMISNRIVLPGDKEKKLKDRLEQALIERIAANPQDIEAYERLGDYYIESNNYEESLECFKHVLKLSPINRKAKIRVRRLKKMLGK